MPHAEMTPDASDLLAWLAARGGSALQRDIGDTAARRFRRASVYGPLVDELLAAGAIVLTCDRPKTYSVAEATTPAAPTSPSGSGARLRAMLADAAAELDDVPDGLRAWWSTITVRDRLVASMRVRNGLPPECECCGPAGHAVDRAVVEAFDCEMP